MQENINRILNLIIFLNNHTRLYNAGKPVISDAEWDKNYFELQDLEEKTGLIFNFSPTQTIFYENKTELKKVVHNHKMLSLAKTKSINELKTFFNDKEYVAMCKLDGLTCSLTYKDGKLIAAETRGNGIIGEDILHNIKTIPSVPIQIPYKQEIVIDGEIICTYEDFKPFSKEYKNPRNFAAGSIRLLDSEECSKRRLTFVAWEVVKGFDHKLFIDNLRELEKLCFTVTPWVTNLPYENAIQVLQDLAQVNHYPIDGVVFKFKDIAYGKSLGETTHHFKNALAYKFFDETYPTKMLDIEWTMGRTGVLTPVAIFEPIDIDGTIVERASLHNISVMQETLGTKPFVGQKIWISKRNMIIPQIEEAEKNYE